MSLVSAFATAMFAQAAPIIGQEDVVIGTVTLSCVLNEVTDGSNFQEGGYEISKTLSAVCLTSALPATTILKKSATARSLTFRVDSVSKGATLTTITLTQVTKA